MSGIYLHIPFCRQACHYCDFHFSTVLKTKTALLKAMEKEIELQKGYLTSPLRSIYFGGGTPSLLSAGEINGMIDKLQKNHQIEPNAEITLEANPDDLSTIKLKELMDAGINRLSIGVQSFCNEDLLFMNRTHNARQALTSIIAAQDAGFENISVDLIYGMPTLSDKNWRANLRQIIELKVPHLSAYCLTVEPNTALAHFIRQGTTPDVDEQSSNRQFKILMDKMKAGNFIHYEISNFAKDGFISRHNSSYWFNGKYLGIGPSAHSYNGETRRWNVANNIEYIRSFDKGKPCYQSEELSTRTKYNEYVMTSLRTIWGCDLDHVLTYFKEEALAHCLKEAETYIESGMISKRENKLTLTGKGLFIADRIASDLFIISD